MLDYHPSGRLMMADVIGHPWVQGNTPSDADVQAEFANRHQIVKDRVSIEKAEERRAKQQKDRTRRAINGKLYKSIPSLDGEDEHNVVRPVFKPYDTTLRTNTCFFSNDLPEDIIEGLVEVLQKTCEDGESLDF